MRGFTLIELLVALAIVGVLLSLALPSYEAHRLRSVQTQAMVTLQQLALRQSRLRLANGVFENASGLLALGALPTDVSRHYRLVVEISQRGATYLMRLQPKTRRVDDPEISLDYLGRKLPVDLWL